MQIAIDYHQMVLENLFIRGRATDNAENVRAAAKKTLHRPFCDLDDTPAEDYKGAAPRCPTRDPQGIEVTNSNTYLNKSSFKTLNNDN